jgi:hypothetical protein
MNLIQLVLNLIKDAPAFLSAVGIVKSVFAEIAAGQTPTITTAEVASVEKLVSDLEALSKEL